MAPAPAFKVLAIDGGGIRGIIPALILQAIEERTGKPICELFDFLAGTSTGGIIALGLVKPGAAGRPEKAARDVVTLYEREGLAIFPRDLGQQMRDDLHMSAIHGPKYSADGVDRTLDKYFGETRLKDALKPVLVSSYDIEKQMPVFFKSFRARDDPDYDFPMRAVARATSAAPTYFPPEKIPTSDPLNYYALVDGGVVAGNPAMCAYAEAVRLCNDASRGILLVSLGTGELRHALKFADACTWGQVQWAQPIIDIVLQGSNTTVDYQLQQLLPSVADQQTYFRFQVELSQAGGDMDNASPQHLKQLIDLTEAYLGDAETKGALDRACSALMA